MMTWSRAIGWSWLAWALSACGSPVSIGNVRNDADATNLDDSGGATGSGGESGSAGHGGASGSGAAGGGGASGSAGHGGASGRGGAAGASIDAATDVATTDGAGGGTDASTDDAADGSGQGGTAGEGGASMSDGAAGTGDATGDRPDAVEGGPGTQPACARILATVNRDSWIAFDSDRDALKRNLYMMRPDLSGLTQLTTGTNVDREPFFSYDGTRLSYTSVVAGISQIFIMDLASRTSVQVTRRPEGADQSSFSRDGQWVAFHSGRSIYVIKTDGTGERLVGTGPDYVNDSTWPAFSADGTVLLFDQGDVYSLKLDGTGLRSVVNNGGSSSRMSAVSPSGVDLAISLACNPSQGIWTVPFAMTTEGCSGHRVTPYDNFNSWRPTWGTGSVLAYYRADRGTNRAVIVMISTVDPQPCFLTAGPEDSRNPSWSQ
ncbi:MAG TPA: hypothetical protein VK540_19985 [Polyangiaceae bacterium]|nr:hypothetical protein [Polyangiaceae bacterium]